MSLKSESEDLIKTWINAEQIDMQAKVIHFKLMPHDGIFHEKYDIYYLVEWSHA